MADQHVPRVYPRNLAHTITDYGYMFTGPYEIDAARRARYVQWVEEKREAARDQNRWLVTVAIMGHHELAHGRILQSPQGFCLCTLGEETACQHGMQPTLLLLNFASHLHSWDTFRQQDVVERLRALREDIILLAPGEESLASALIGTSVREAVVTWRRQLRTTTIALQAAISTTRPPIMRHLPTIIVALPGRGEYYYINNNNNEIRRKYGSHNTSKIMLIFLQHKKKKIVSNQNIRSAYGYSRERLSNFYARPDVANRWRVAHKVAFLKIEGTTHYAHNKIIIQSLQQICCGFCRAPPTIIGAAWEDITPVWLQRPAHQP